VADSGRGADVDPRRPTSSLNGIIWPRKPAVPHQLLSTPRRQHHLDTDFTNWYALILGS
jgi:hypothetical protein